MTVAQLRRSAILFLSVIGLLLVSAPLLAQPLGLGRTPEFGVLQMTAFLAGITALTFAFYLYLYSLRPVDAPRSLQADVGVRLSATGLVLAYASGFADLFSIGTHVQPEFQPTVCWTAATSRAGSGAGGRGRWHDSLSHQPRPACQFLARVCIQFQEK